MMEKARKNLGGEQSTTSTITDQSPPVVEVEVEEETTPSPSSSSVLLGVDCDWIGRPCNPSKHGGLTPAIFILGLQAFEIMAIGAVGNNLITYVFEEMHFPLSKSANIVTNFVGTVFLLSLLGGFLSDSYLGSFWTMLIFGFVELSGLILLSVQAHLPQLRPPPCKMLEKQHYYCEEAKGYSAVVFFVALYLVALGSGCLKPNIISHGAHQFRKLYSDHDSNINLHYSNNYKLSTYFNAAYFAFCMGELVALTVLVWVQTHSGMSIGFGVSAAAMAMGLLCFISGTTLYRNKPPRGSIFTPIAQVLAAAIAKRKHICHSNSEMFRGGHNNMSQCSTGNLLLTKKFRFLDKACIKIRDGTNQTLEESPWRLCSVTQVEQVKILISVVPIFACTIMSNTILAQLQTFSVQQGSCMNTHITKGFKIPPASLQSIPYIMLIFLVPLYETAFVPFARKLTGSASGISPLMRIGIGLFIATLSMVSAALVEKKRRNMAVDAWHQTLSIFWIAPQFLVFGLSEMFTAVGLIEFFYRQSLEGMQSFLIAMTYCSYSFGFYLSSLLVSLVNKITATASSSGGGWLSENDLNKDRLDLFYWLLAGLSLINFLNYQFWSAWYSYNPSDDLSQKQSPGLNQSDDQLDHPSSQLNSTQLASFKAISSC